MAEDKQKTELWETHVLQSHAALDRDDFDEAQGLLNYAFQEASEYGAENPRVAPPSSP